MALFHLSVTQTKRSAGQSAIASAAYRAGERLYSEYYGEYSDYTRKILRESGVSEEVIQRIRELDWQDFNADRRFWEHFSSNQEELYTQKTEEEASVALNIQQLLDSIENEQLLQILMETDKKTLQILLLKMWGFSVREIAGQMGLPEKTIYTRMERLKKKIKKVLRK